MDNQKAKMLGENLAHYKRMQENGTVDIIEFHTTDGQKFGIGNVAAIQLLLSVTVTELERQLHTARFGDIPERLEKSREYKTARNLKQALNDMGLSRTILTGATGRLTRCAGCWPPCWKTPPCLSFESMKSQNNRRTDFKAEKPRSASSLFNR